ncbi:MAG: alpha/beta hydrolase [Gemmataceae bacterium]
MRRDMLLSCFVFLSVGPLRAQEEPFVKTGDIAYSSDKSDYAQQQCRLDVYAPKGKTGFPTIVWFHGGGLKGGKRQSGEAFARRFTREGCGVVLVGYRFSPQVKSPTYIEDAAEAVAWTLKNIEKYKGDPGKVFVSGHSAGGYLTAMVGLDARYLEKFGASPGKLAGLMPVAGQMLTHATIREERGLPAGRPLLDELAPCYHVNKNAPPFLCFAGELDLPTRAEENLYFAAAMKAAGHKQTECLIVKGRNHGSIAGKFADKDDEVAAAMLAFIQKVTGK